MREGLSICKSHFPFLLLFIEKETPPLNMCFPSFSFMLRRFALPFSLYWRRRWTFFFPCRNFGFFGRRLDIASSRLRRDERFISLPFVQKGSSDRLSFFLSLYNGLRLTPRVTPSSHWGMNGHNPPCKLAYLFPLLKKKGKIVVDPPLRSGGDVLYPSFWRSDNFALLGRQLKNFPPL